MCCFTPGVKVIAPAFNGAWDVEVRGFDLKPPAEGADPLTNLSKLLPSGTNTLACAFREGGGNNPDDATVAKSIAFPSGVLIEIVFGRKRDAEVSECDFLVRLRSISIPSVFFTTTLFGRCIKVVSREIAGV